MTLASQGENKPYKRKKLKRVRTNFKDIMKESILNVIPKFFNHKIHKILLIIMISKFQLLHRICQNQKVFSEFIYHIW